MAQQGLEPTSSQAKASVLIPGCPFCNASRRKAASPAVPQKSPARPSGHSLEYPNCTPRAELWRGSSGSGERLCFALLTSQPVLCHGGQLLTTGSRNLLEKHSLFVKLISSSTCHLDAFFRGLVRRTRAQQPPWLDPACPPCATAFMGLSSCHIAAVTRSFYTRDSQHSLPSPDLPPFPLLRHSLHLPFLEAALYLVSHVLKADGSR